MCDRLIDCVPQCNSSHRCPECVALGKSSVKEEPTTDQLFQSLADKTLDRVRDTYNKRGKEYGDSLRHCQWLTMMAVAKEYGVEIPEKARRALALAVMVDIKYQRNEGGFKDDSVIDGIAFASALAEEMRNK